MLILLSEVLIKLYFLVGFLRRIVIVKEIYVICRFKNLLLLKVSYPGTFYQQSLAKFYNVFVTFWVIEKPQIICGLVCTKPYMIVIR
jgi:hypothetical protein